jgi:hypothetical protein
MVEEPGVWSSGRTIADIAVPLQKMLLETTNTVLCAVRRFPRELSFSCPDQAVVTFVGIEAGICDEPPSIHVVG